MRGKTLSLPGSDSTSPFSGVSGSQRITDRSDDEDQKFSAADGGDQFRRRNLNLTSDREEWGALPNRGPDGLSGLSGNPTVLLSPRLACALSSCELALA